MSDGKLKGSLVGRRGAALAAGLMICLAGVAWSGCGSSDNTTSVEQSVEKGLQEAKKGFEKGVEEAESGLKKSGKEARKSLEKAKESTQEGIEKGKEEVKKGIEEAEAEGYSAP